ncbi:MAG: hypothetical protein KME25_21275 [Symplocastrum torsivum CPER-KK1]|uniref:Uncharacterized protein n=1 Tax=Symplocastrum torsivum CPER-KK1 TaxID=450513 RepID=A0A951PMZ8_9CYAN|nr:hypothetical protein [Symplocastrum torsivum CPER-KK1]
MKGRSDSFGCRDRLSQPKYSKILIGGSVDLEGGVWCDRSFMPSPLLQLNFLRINRLL